MTSRTSFSAGVALLLAAVAIPALVAQLSTKPQRRPKISEVGAAAISKQLAAAVERGDTPGVVVLVVDRDGILYEGAAGRLDVGKNVVMPTDAIFNIASMTKPVTWLPS